MKVISNAMMSQVEVLDTRRWEQGPLELIFLPERLIGDGEEKSRLLVSVYEWNQHHCGGMVRSGETMEALAGIFPTIEERKNPNFVFVPPHITGSSELDTMLASLLPDAAVASFGIKRTAANMSLMAWGEGLASTEAQKIHAAFEQMIWTRIAPKARMDASHFASNSPLRLLAGDHKFWMNRVYRVALERREALFEPTTHEDGGWRPLQDLQADIYAAIEPELRTRYQVRRPLMGGTIWDPEDPADRDAVIDEAINGAGVMASLEPVIELLLSHKAHEDYSDNASWIKEDFERTFYKKRARLKVELVETVDDLPVWTLGENEGYAQVLYRDLLAFLDVKEQRLLLALRSGKTASEIARENNLRGHASVSRAIAAMKKKIRPLLG